jgi:hypothetical protein
MYSFEAPEIHEEPQPGQCYCHLLQGRTLCAVCEEEYIGIRAEEAFQEWWKWYVTPAIQLAVTPAPTILELGPLEVLSLKGIAA